MSSDRRHPQNVLTAALAYAARGWFVFPATPGEKKSYKSAEHSNGRKWGKTTDPVEIENDWRRWPNANVGIATGKDNGFFVVEADTKEGHGVDGLAGIKGLETEHGQLPDTLTAESPSGSIHRYFKHPGGDVWIKNSASEIAPGVDVRGDGGMVIAPPSVRKDGTYRWINDLPIADAPEWLIEAVSKKGKAKKTGQHSTSNPKANASELALALAVIPNDKDVGWEEWNKVGMALWRATGGSSEGLDLFDSWSAKNLEKNDAAYTAVKWDGYEKCPPDEITGRTIFYMANEAQPNWRRMERDDIEPSEGGALTSQLVEMLQIENQGANNQHGKYTSQSHLLFGFLIKCARAKVDRKVASDAILDPKYEGKAIHHHCKANGTAYIERQIEKAWKTVAQSFELDGHGNPKQKSQHNVKLALAKLNVTLRYDEFNDTVLIDGLKGHTKLNDAAADKLWLLIDENFCILPPENLFDAILGTLARDNSFHPVQDYLNSLEWDGAARIDNWLVTYCGAKDTPYVRAVGKIMMVAGVRRIVDPGCKFDEMVILEGPQGTDKSTLVKIMAVKPNWFTDDLPLNADSKKVIEQLQGKWILEAAEMVGIRKTTDAHLKSILSRQTDRARLAYARFPVDAPRQFIIIGTSNGENYLYDITGNRRFWPVKVGRIDIDKFKKDIGQLWAEAAHLEKNGASIRLDPKLWDEATKEQAERAVSDPWFDILQDTIGELNGKILNRDVWTIVGMDGEKRGQEHNRRIGDAMHALKFIRKDNGLSFDGKKGKGYVRGKGKARIFVVRDRDNVAAAYTWQAANEALEKGRM